MENLLERLEQWLRLNRPDYFSRLQPGLTLEEITEISAPLGFKLPDEVIKLYQWHNGTLGFYDEFFIIYRFATLKDAVERTLEMRESTAEYPLGVPDESDEFYSTGWNIGFPNHYDWQDNWFSIFFEVKDTIASMISSSSLTHAPIVKIAGEDLWTTLWFNSLKGFISAVLECYETDLYLLESFCLEDAEEIWAKYRDLV